MRREIWRAGLAGVGLAAIGQILGLMLTGGGHGWVEPFFFSPALWVMLPATMIRLRLRRLGRIRHVLPDAAILLAAVLLDILLAVRTIRNEEPIFLTLGSETLTHGKVDWGLVPFTLSWIGLWLWWQIAALLCLPFVRRRPWSRG